MPNMTVFVPKDESELRDMLATAVKMDAPTAIRYPRGAGLGVPLSGTFCDIPIGKAEILTKAAAGQVAFLAVGPMVHRAQQAAAILAEDGISASVVNMRFVKPLDTAVIAAMAAEHRLLVTLEENTLAGGFGSAVAEYLMDSGLAAMTDLLRLGLPDRFIEQGKPEELLELCGLQPEQIAATVKERLK
jgi:1-deoxy-D-xylulose-5-phosphate synthase